MNYSVKYFYLATGMEGRAEEVDYGIVEADTEHDAVNKIANQEYPNDVMYGPNNSFSAKEFFKGCLSAKIINKNDTNR